uniref:Uncharacterized protein n=1 Tax=Globodera rostochiensis TaxID=31243 RepID=A0A914HBD1_GLORO
MDCPSRSARKFSSCKSIWAGIRKNVELESGLAARGLPSKRQWWTVPIRNNCGPYPFVFLSYRVIQSLT